LFRFFGLFTVQAFKNGWPDPLLREKLRQPLTLLGSENGPFEQKLLDNLLLLRILQEYGKGDGFIYRVDRPLLADCCLPPLPVFGCVQLVTTSGDAFG
jgi:hypothetical protein